ncbi:MAG: transporter substrate-binding protein [Tannerellaceae bacterium]|nr:transporter substrate-binding protein [Tannerellaceae bacterium]
MRKIFRKVAGIATLATLLFHLPSCSSSGSKGGGEKSTDDSAVEVGILHSLSGTMAISEVSLRDVLLMGIEEINAAGGVLGKKIVPKVETLHRIRIYLPKKPKNCLAKIK